MRLHVPPGDGKPGIDQELDDDLVSALINDFMTWADDEQDWVLVHRDYGLEGEISENLALNLLANYLEGRGEKP